MGNVKKKVNIILRTVVFLSIVSTILPANVSANLVLDESRTKGYSPVYDDYEREVETSISFHITENETVYFKLSTYEGNDVYLNESWYTHLLVYDDNQLLYDLGERSNDTPTQHISLEKNKTYTLKVVVHLPANLTEGTTYTSMVVIAAHKETGDGDSGATEDQSEMFTARITPTKDYLVCGVVYDKNKNPLPNVPVNITNENSGLSNQTITNANGYYEYNIRDLNYYRGDRITVNATYKNRTVENLTTVDILKNYVECNLTIPLGYFVWGTVLDLQESPVANATVEITNKATGKNIKIKTNGNGYYECDLYELGYSNGDIIYVRVVHNNLVGQSEIVIDVLNPNSECNILLKEPVAENNVSGRDSKTYIKEILIATILGSGISLAGMVYLLRRKRKIRK